MEDGNGSSRACLRAGDERRSRDEDSLWTDAQARWPRVRARRRRSLRRPAVGCRVLHVQHYFVCHEHANRDQERVTPAPPPPRRRKSRKRTGQLALPTISATCSRSSSPRPAVQGGSYVVQSYQRLLLLHRHGLPERLLRSQDGRVAEKGSLPPRSGAATLARWPSATGGGMWRFSRPPARYDPWHSSPAPFPRARTPSSSRPSALQRRPIRNGRISGLATLTRKEGLMTRLRIPLLLLTITAILIAAIPALAAGGDPGIATPAAVAGLGLSVIPSVAIDSSAACIVQPEARTISLADPKLPNSGEQPILKSTCNINRTCDYPPPSSVSCFSPNGNCSTGADGYAPYGYVVCDSVRTYCSPPPSDR